MSNDSHLCPVSVLIAVRNEERNLPRCLEGIRDWAGEVVVIDSQSSDRTVDVAKSFGATVLQFDYSGGWPKKRQWALDTYSFRHEWILLLDADEILEDPVKREIDAAVRQPRFVGYYLPYQIIFLGRKLRFGDTQLWKLALIRKGHAHYEKRLEDQDASMQDMEIHEHVVADGPTGRLRCPVRHENINNLAHYIDKHNAYSNWEARVLQEGCDSELPPALFGNQAQRRRWLKRVLMGCPGSPLLLFLYKYLFRLGLLDGIPGLIHCTFLAIQQFQIKAKIYEAKLWKEDATKEGIQKYWDKNACGEIYAEGASLRDQLERQARIRYELEPYIRDFAGFGDGRGKNVLEIGVGMGVDYLEWAKSQPKSLTGVDLTPRAINFTHERLMSYGLTSALQVADAENLPFDDNSFDLIYSWGVLHHSPDTPRAIGEVLRVLKPGGEARIMIYHKYSMVGYMLWLRYALLAGRPWRGLKHIYAHHLESPGTKAYTVDEARKLFAGFTSTKLRIKLSFGDLLLGAVGQRHRGMFLAAAKALYPRWLIKRLLPNHGLYLLIQARK
ncbi:MAG TPA: methyltransferase domain-containing protein [Gemmataceae bacterium]